MSSLTEQSESETTNRKSGSSNGSAASPNLSQNAHGNRDTDTKGKSRMASRVAVLGIPNGGNSVLWDSFIFRSYVCMYNTKSDPSNYICTCRWRNNFQLWLISVISVFVIDLTSFRYMTTGFRLRGQECRSLKAAPIICICTYGVQYIKSRTEWFEMPAGDKGKAEIWWSSITPNESQNFAKQSAKVSGTFWSFNFIKLQFFPLSASS